MAENRKFVLIVGVQKSGTSLLSRMLQETGLIENPFNKEGHEFWGNIPHFAPTEFPAGTIYARSKGEMGHEIGAEDAAPDVREELLRRLAELPAKTPAILNKNPYNTVRLPWIKALFPESLVVAVVRKAAPNVFSLTKKYIPHKGRGEDPDEGWWGVKPKGWRRMVSEDKVIQSARQWEAVNRKLIEDRKFADIFVPYHKFCETPEKYIKEILRASYGRDMEIKSGIQPVKCLDAEYTKGSQLMSKNRYYGKLGTFEIPDDNNIEIEALSDEDLDKIEGVCGALEHSIEVLN